MKVWGISFFCHFSPSHSPLIAAGRRATQWNASMAAPPRATARPPLTATARVRARAGGARARAGRRSLFSQLTCLPASRPHNFRVFLPGLRAAALVAPWQLAGACRDAPPPPRSRAQHALRQPAPVPPARRCTGCSRTLPCPPAAQASMRPPASIPVPPLPAPPHNRPRNPPAVAPHRAAPRRRGQRGLCVPALHARGRAGHHAHRRRHRHNLRQRLEPPGALGRLAAFRGVWGFSLCRGACWESAQTLPSSTTATGTPRRVYGGITVALTFSCNMGVANGKLPSVTAAPVCAEGLVCGWVGGRRKVAHCPPPAPSSASCRRTTCKPWRGRTASGRSGR